VTAGDLLNYTITLKSYYETPISNVILTDILDDRLTIEEGSLTCGTINGQTITITQASVAPLETIQCSFTVRTGLQDFTSTLYQDDVEMGAGTWQVINPQGPNTWIRSDTESHSPSNSWFSPELGVENNTQMLTSQSILLGSSPQLSFYHRYQTEDSWDGGLVEISTDGGITWIDLGPSFVQNGYNGGLGLSTNDDIAGRPAFTGSIPSFIQSIVDLGSYADQTVQVRFVFGEDSSVSGLGWYIDDIKISSIYKQINEVCATFDESTQPQCSSIETLILPCQSSCVSCEDDIQNGDEAGVDCGGSLCAPCPCTQSEVDLILDGSTMATMTQLIKRKITIQGGAQTQGNALIDLRAGQEIEIYDEFSTGGSSVFQLSIEDCIEN